MTSTYEWRGGFDNTEVNALHAGFDHPRPTYDWCGQVGRAGAT
jgi:hypothetical protein